MAPKEPASNAAPKPPKKPGRMARVLEVFKQTRQLDPSIPWWMLGVFLVVVAVAVAVGLVFNAPVYAAFIGVPLGALAATLVMSRMAERAAYRQLEGQPGAVGAALTSLRRGWFTDPQPVGVEAARGGDMTQAGLVFRAIGRPGVVLVAEGPTGRAQRLLAAERKRVERVLPGVPIVTYRVGDGSGEDVVPIRKLVGKVQRMRPVLTKAEADAVHKRLRSLGGVKVPLPPGVDPNRVRVDRKAMRGR